MAGKAVEVRGLVREFKGRRVVDGLSLDVEAGQIYGFLGPNGAGKSTSVLMLTTLLAPSAGQARICGHDVVRQQAAVRGLIGAALQEVSLDPLLSGREHLLLLGALHGMSRRERGRRAEELLERVGLSEAADRRAGSYSGGMRRRLDLALALLRRPRALFLDEPTTGLDPQSRKALWAEVLLLARQEGTAIFLTTQYLEEADALADRVGIIVEGRLVAEDTPARLKGELGHPTLELSPAQPEQQTLAAGVLARFGPAASAGAGLVAVRLEHGAAELADVIRALDAAGVGIAGLRLSAPSLDDVFMAKIGQTPAGAGRRAEAVAR